MKKQLLKFSTVITGFIFLTSGKCVQVRNSEFENLIFLIEKYSTCKSESPSRADQDIANRVFVLVNDCPDSIVTFQQKMDLVVALTYFERYASDIFVAKIDSAIKADSSFLRSNRTTLLIPPLASSRGRNPLVHFLISDSIRIDDQLSKLDSTSGCNVYVRRMRSYVQSKVNEPNFDFTLYNKYTIKNEVLKTQYFELHYPELFKLRDCQIKR